MADITCTRNLWQSKFVLDSVHDQNCRLLFFKDINKNVQVFLKLGNLAIWHCYTCLINFSCSFCFCFFLKKNGYFLFGLGDIFWKFRSQMSPWKKVNFVPWMTGMTRMTGITRMTKMTGMTRMTGLNKMTRLTRITRMTRITAGWLGWLLLLGSLGRHGWLEWLGWLGWYWVD